MFDFDALESSQLQVTTLGAARVASPRWPRLTLLAGSGQSRSTATVSVTLDVGAPLMVAALGNPNETVTVFDAVRRSGVEEPIGMASMRLSRSTSLVWLRSWGSDHAHGGRCRSRAVRQASLSKEDPMS